MSWDGIKIEEQKMRSEKLARGGPKSRIHWGFNGVKQKDWDGIFKKRVETKSK